MTELKTKKSRITIAKTKSGMLAWTLKKSSVAWFRRLVAIAWFMSINIWNM